MNQGIISFVGSSSICEVFIKHFSILLKVISLRFIGKNTTNYDDAEGL